jgi:hypothetical protein
MCGLSVGAQKSFHLRSFFFHESFRRGQQTAGGSETAGGLDFDDSTIF